MKVKFSIVKGKSEVCSIYVRFWDSNRIDQRTRTGLSVQHKDWSIAKEQVKNIVTTENKDFINSKLRSLSNFLFDEYNIDYNTQEFIGTDWLKKKVEKFFGRVDKKELHKHYFLDWINKFIEECPNKLYQGEPIKKRTIQHYITTKYKLENFEIHYKTKLRFQDLGLDFYHNFLLYCRSFEKLNNNTIGGYVTNIKKWCKMIDIEGLPINPQYKSSEFSTISNKTKDVYLTEDEINAVFNHDFSYSERLDNTRDNFIFGLRTGLRISDFLSLQQFNFIGNNIEIETSKTNYKVMIPIHRQIQSILDKKNGELPRPISDSNFNDYVKEVCKAVGFTEIVEGAKMINKKDDVDFFPNAGIIANKMRKEFGKYPKYELITSHTCRRSFASNLYGKIPNMTIMAITGHKTETQFLKYIKITPKENAEKLRAFWNKQNNL